MGIEHMRKGMNINAAQKRDQIWLQRDQMKVQHLIEARNMSKPWGKIYLSRFYIGSLAMKGCDQIVFRTLD